MVRQSEAHAGKPFLAPGIAAFICHHAKEPGAKLSLVLHAGELSPCRERRFLHGVLSRLRVVKHRKGEAKAGLDQRTQQVGELSLIHISEPTRLGMISYAVFCLKKKKKK